MKKKKINEYAGIAFTLLGVLFGMTIFAIIFSSMGNISLDEVNTQSSNSLNFTATSLTETLSPIGSGITYSEVKANNDTWLNFNSSTDFVSTTDSTGLNFPENITATVRFKTTDLSSQRVVFGMWNNTANLGYRLYIRTDNTIDFQIGNGTSSKQIKTLTPLVNDTNFHIVSVRTEPGEKMQMFVDGHETTYLQQDTAYAPNYNNENFFIGKNSEGVTNYLNGSVSELTMYENLISPNILRNSQLSDLPNYTLNQSSKDIPTSNILNINSSLLYYINNSLDVIRYEDDGNTLTTVYESPKTLRSMFVTSTGTLIVTDDFANISISVGNDTNWSSPINVLQCHNGSAGYTYVTRWGFAEAKNGNLLIGEYGSPAGTNCSYIYLSSDGGYTWNTVYNASDQFSGNADTDKGHHIHKVSTDPYTGYIYATQGDNAQGRLLRSQDNGSNWVSLGNGSNLWQFIGITFESGRRIFGTDSSTSATAGFWITEDDITFTNKYLFASQNFGFVWDMKKDNINGNIIAGTKTQGVNKTWGFYISPDQGDTWFGIDMNESLTSSSGLDSISEFDELGFSYYYDDINLQAYKFNFNDPSRYNLDEALRYNVNENNGTILYDSSGNSKNGVITGATWANDGVLNTLTAAVDYTLGTTTGLFTIVNDDYLFSWIMIDWTYYALESYSTTRAIQENSLNAVVTYTSGASTQLNTVSIAIILILLIGVFLVFWKIFVTNKKSSDSGGGNFG